MAYNCIVVVREVWDTRDLTGAVLEGDQVKAGALATRFEPEDLNALEMALRIKDEHGGTVTALSIGEAGDVDVLRECLYRGVDAVVRIEGDAPALDTQAAAKAIADAVGQQGDYSLILVGVTVAEGENSHLGSHIAGVLGIEQISYVDSLVEIAEGKVVAKRAIEMGYEDVEAQTPALLSVGVALVEDDPRTPRSAKAMLKLKAKKAEIPTVAASATAPLNTAVATREPVEERVVESKDVDPQSEAALKEMMDTVLKGE